MFGGCRLVVTALLNLDHDCAFVLFLSIFLKQLHAGTVAKHEQDTPPQWQTSFYKGRAPACSDKDKLTTGCSTSLGDIHTYTYIYIHAVYEYILLLLLLTPDVIGASVTEALPKSIERFLFLLLFLLPFLLLDVSGAGAVEISPA
jgi:hypothetical protein